MAKKPETRTAKLYELSVPPEAVEQAADERTLELMRVWLVAGRPTMMLRPAFHDPKMFGVLLAETAHHLAQTYAARRGLDAAEARAAIETGWTEGRNAPYMTALETTQAD